MTLTEGSPAFDAWQEPDYPTFMKVYLFSVANSRDVEEKGTKPHIKEMGPYVFRYEEHKIVFSNFVLKISEILSKDFGVIFWKLCVLLKSSFINFENYKVIILYHQ